MKDAWVGLLRATLKEVESQIKSTGSVFAYGGKQTDGVLLVSVMIVRKGIVDPACTESPFGEGFGETQYLAAFSPVDLQ